MTDALTGFEVSILERCQNPFSVTDSILKRATHSIWMSQLQNWWPLQIFYKIDWSELQKRSDTADRLLLSADGKWAMWIWALSQTKAQTLIIQYSIQRKVRIPASFPAYTAGLCQGGHFFISFIGKKSHQGLPWSSSGLDIQIVKV